MRQSQGPFGDGPRGVGETESRRLTPSIGLTPDDAGAADSSNEDFLFHLYRGSELLQDNRVHEAKSELEQALSRKPADPKSQDLLAVVYFRLGMYPRAIAIYEVLVRQHPESVTPLEALGTPIAVLTAGPGSTPQPGATVGAGSTPARAWPPFHPLLFHSFHGVGATSPQAMWP